MGVMGTRFISMDRQELGRHRWFGGSELAEGTEVTGSRLSVFEYEGLKQCEIRASKGDTPKYPLLVHRFPTKITTHYPPKRGFTGNLLKFPPITPYSYISFG